MSFFFFSVSLLCAQHMSSNHAGRCKTLILCMFNTKYKTLEPVETCVTHIFQGAIIWICQMPDSYLPASMYFTHHRTDNSIQSMHQRPINFYNSHLMQSAMWSEQLLEKETKLQLTLVFSEIRGVQPVCIVNCCLSRIELRSVFSSHLSWASFRHDVLFFLKILLALVAFISKWRETGRGQREWGRHAAEGWRARNWTRNQPLEDCSLHTWVACPNHCATGAALGMMLI